MINLTVSIYVYIEAVGSAVPLLEFNDILSAEGEYIINQHWCANGSYRRCRL